MNNDIKMDFVCDIVIIHVPFLVKDYSDGWTKPQQAWWVTVEKDTNT